MALSIAVNTVRVGKKYRLVNFGETYEFRVAEILDRDDFIAKDLMTLESYHFSQLMQFGKGTDYLLEQI